MNQAEMMRLRHYWPNLMCMFALGWHLGFFLGLAQGSYWVLALRLVPLLVAFYVLVVRGYGTQPKNDATRSVPSPKINLPRLVCLGAMLLGVALCRGWAAILGKGLSYWAAEMVALLLVATAAVTIASAHDRRRTDLCVDRPKPGPLD